MNKQIITTEEGLNELKSELKKRKEETRKEIANEISRAREQGDLSENAAYTAALEAKQFNENRIQELEDMIKNSVVQETNTKDSLVGIGESVKIRRMSDKKEFSYKLVGENESNPSEGEISIKSPIGSALMGKKTNEIVDIDLPSGTQKYKVISIN